MPNGQMTGPAESCVVVNNAGVNEICPFCGSAGIIRLGAIAYPQPIMFADTSIRLIVEPELWGCRDCLSRFIQHAVPEPDAEMFYAAKTSKRWTSPLPFAERRTDELVRLVHKHTWTGAQVLDIGCSTGAFLNFAEERGCITHGLESSVAARNAASESGHDCRQSIEDFEYNMLFDIIFCFDVIEHVYSARDFLSRYSAALKPGGKFFILTGDVQCRLSKRLGSKWWYVRYPEHISFPSIKYLESLPQFEVLDICRTFAFRHFEGPLSIKLIKMFVKILKNEYTGCASPFPDHIAIVLRKKY